MIWFVAKLLSSPPSAGRLRFSSAKAATTTIPVVFSLGIDPVQFGLVTSLNHPCGNITGVAALQSDPVAKRVQVLHELVPKAGTVALLVNPTTQPENLVQSVRGSDLNVGIVV